jgi:hypothetical protein
MFLHRYDGDLKLWYEPRGANLLERKCVLETISMNPHYTLAASQ